MVLDWGQPLPAKIYLKVLDRSHPPLIKNVQTKNFLGTKAPQQFWIGVNPPTPLKNVQIEAEKSAFNNLVSKYE